MRSALFWLVLFLGWSVLTYGAVAPTGDAISSALALVVWGAMLWQLPDRLREGLPPVAQPPARERELAPALSADERRALRMATNGGHHTAAEWRELLAQFDSRCVACGRRRNITRDHVIPVALGGSDDISNIQPLCRSCNSRKGLRIIDYRLAPRRRR